MLIAQKIMIQAHSMSYAHAMSYIHAMSYAHTMSYTYRMINTHDTYEETKSSNIKISLKFSCMYFLCTLYTSKKCLYSVHWYSVQCTLVYSRESHSLSIVIKASEMLVAPQISECFGLPWSAISPVQYIDNKYRLSIYQHF